MSATPTSPTPTMPPRLTLAPGDQPETDLEVRRSRFLARAARTDDEDAARAFVSLVRTRYPDARHHCSAFTVPLLGPRPVERSSDDGEPSGTAGQPMLEVLRATGLSATTVVVTRYFGGTLLGTGGLVRAYSEATSSALAAARRVQLVTRHLWDVRLPVSQAGRVEAELRGLGTAHGEDISVEETIWGPTHAVLMLSTTASDGHELGQVVAALTQGSVPAPQHAGTRVVEKPL